MSTDEKKVTRVVVLSSVAVALPACRCSPSCMELASFANFAACVLVEPTSHVREVGWLSLPSTVDGSNGESLFIFDCQIRHLAPPLSGREPYHDSRKYARCLVGVDYVEPVHRPPQDQGTRGLLHGGGAMLFVGQRWPRRWPCK